MRLNGIDAVLLNREQVREIIPMADFSENVRFPIFGGLMQPSAGTARHDAVAWGYARQADSMGVDIIQNCWVGRNSFFKPSCKRLKQYSSWFI